MSAFNSLLDSYVTSPDPGPPPSDGGAGPSTARVGPHIADMQGTPPLTGPHNIPLHVGALGIFALIIVVGLRLIGFRFSGAGNLGLGVGVGR